MTVKTKSKISDGMHVIMYPRTTAVVPTSVTDERMAYATRTSELAKSLGLTQIAQRREQSKHAHVGLAWCADNEVPHLNAKEYEIWCAYLRGSYMKNGGNTLGLRRPPATWKEYNHVEDVPGPVLELIDRVKGLFTDLEIRSPEPHMVDPVLFGHIVAGGRHVIVLLARWGRDSSVDAIESVQDVRRILDERRRIETADWIEEQMDPISFSLVCFALSTLGFIVGQTISMNTGLGSQGWVVSPLAILGALVVAITLIVQRWMATRARQEANTAFAKEYPHLVPLL